MNRILLATDLKPESENALKRAIQLVEATGVELHILHVASILTISGNENKAKEAEKNIENQIHALIKKNAISKDFDFQIHISRRGRVRDEIDALARELDVSLIVMGAGNRDAKTGKANQYFAQLNISHNFYLNRRNVVNLKNHTYYLNSKSYIINELFRFGGINSIRGFNENSLQANLYTALMAEYRYVLSPGMYIHSITDYGYYQDASSETRNNILGLGFGFGLYTKTGLFNIVYANGSTKDQQIKLSNSIIHISFKTTF